MNYEEKWLKNIPIHIGWYIAGFSDGEGSFNVSLRQKKDYKIQWQVALSFNVSQRDITNLILLKKHLGCGTLRRRKDGVYYFEVQNFRAIKEKVIPFFRKFYFLSSSKKKNFSIFKKIVILMNEEKHLITEGLKEIVNLREKLNEGRGRKRKYNKKDVIKN